MSLTTVPGSLLTANGNFTFGNANVTTSLTATELKHSGLTFTYGNNIDQLTVFTRPLQLTTEWQDVGISQVDLATGSYAIQLYANDIAAGGTNNNEYYTGVLSWYNGTTDSPLALPTDEIPLHRAGGSVEGGLGLRTFRTPNASGLGLKLQIYSHYASLSVSNYVFKFRRLI